MQATALTLRQARHCPICRCRPAGALPSEAIPSLNASYLEANDGALSLTRTSSANLLRMRGKATKQFVLKPGHLDLGVVKIGQVSALDKF